MGQPIGDNPEPTYPGLFDHQFSIEYESSRKFFLTRFPDIYLDAIEMSLLEIEDNPDAAQNKRLFRDMLDRCFDQKIKLIRHLISNDRNERAMATRNAYEGSLNS
jgi:hypothetical protein